MKDRIASFLVPPLIAVALLYQVLSELQIALTHSATLTIIGVTLAVGACAGLVGALAPVPVRVVVLSACAVVFLDVTFHLEGVLERLNPAVRKSIQRDEQRVSDLHRIKAAVDRYADEVGPPPRPIEYGQGIGPDEWWEGWWDVSSDGGFMDFLSDAGILAPVPKDPENVAPQDGDPRSGRQYVYFVVPPHYDYNGGTCEPERSHYMLAVTDLESDASRPSRKFTGSGCECLWRDTPDFFAHHFDYVICGSFDSSPGTRSRADGIGDGDGTAIEAGASLVEHVPTDQRRVADLLEINEMLQAYLKNVGPLPAPAEYGEAEASRGPGFWYRQWDVSAEDGDGDGIYFLDFLVESGEVSAVPVDPVNSASPDGDPRGGSQYVFFLLPPGSDYAGGPLDPAPNRWHYMLGITDLQSEASRPPEGFPGSGCAALWRDQPNYFQDHFDYIICGSFDATPEDRERGKAILIERSKGATREVVAGPKATEN